MQSHFLNFELRLVNELLLFDLEINEGNDGIEMVLVPRNGVQYMDNTKDDEFIVQMLKELRID